MNGGILQFPSERLVRLPEVKHLTGLSRSMIYKLEGEEKFPRGLRITKRFTAWRLADVNEWISQKLCERDK